MNVLVDTVVWSSAERELGQSGFRIGGGIRGGGIGNWRGMRGLFLRRLFCGFGAFALLVAAIVELLVGGLFLHG